MNPLRLLKWAALAFVLWIGWLILTPFPHYMPPDFGFGFLRNRSDYFYAKGYFIGFYAHIIAAPMAMLVGALQTSSTIRGQWPSGHRRMGRIYVALVLLLAAPGGLIMAQWSGGGFSTRVCFSLIAIMTWWTTWMGWRRAKQSQWIAHREWMMRSYVLMLSAVFLRLAYFVLLSFPFSLGLTYQLSAWISFVPPCLVLEAVLWRHRSMGRDRLGRQLND